MYIKPPKRQLSVPAAGDVLPPPPAENHEHAVTVTVGSGAIPTEIPPTQAWAPPVNSQPAVFVPPSVSEGWSPPPGQVVPGQPVKPPSPSTTMAANQLPNGVDPAAYESMFGEPAEPLDLGSDKLPSALTGTTYSRTTKGDMAAGIVVIILVAVLAISAIIHYRHRRMRKKRDTVPQAKQIDAEGIIPEQGGQFRLKKEMDEEKEVQASENPDSGYGNSQMHRNGRQKSHPIYSIRNPRPNIREPQKKSRPGTPSPPMRPVLSPAKERYYYRDRCRGKLFKNAGGSSSRP